MVETDTLQVWRSHSRIRLSAMTCPVRTHSKDISSIFLFLNMQHNSSQISITTWLIFTENRTCFMQSLTAYFISITLRFKINVSTLKRKVYKIEWLIVDAYGTIISFCYNLRWFKWTKREWQERTSSLNCTENRTGKVFFLEASCLLYI